MGTEFMNQEVARIVRPGDAVVVGRFLPGVRKGSYQPDKGYVVNDIYEEPEGKSNPCFVIIDDTGVERNVSYLWFERALRN